MAFQSATQQLMVPNTDMGQSFNQGAQSADNARNSEMARAKQGIEMIASAAYGVLGNNLNGQADPAQWEQTLDFFQARGVPVDTLRGKPQMANQIARSSMEVLQSSNNEQNFQLALKKFEQEVAQGGTANETYYAPIAGMVDGKPTYVQPGNRGSSNVMDVPDGFTPQQRFEKVDLGTEWLITDTTTGQTQRIPKNNEEAAFQTGFGTEAGKASAGRQADLPKVLAQANNMISSIDGILNDPALESSTGMLAWMQALPGTDQFRFGQRALQLQGQAFLQAFESLKGGGAITEIEGQKATQAIGRLSSSQSPQDYRQALGDLKALIQAGMQRAQQMAATPAQIGGPDQAAPPQQGNQPAGDVVDFTDYFD